MNHPAPLDLDLRVSNMMSKIVTIKSNPHYRIHDVVFSVGDRYLDSGEKVLTLPEFEGTILRRYLVENGPPGSPPNLPLMSKLVDEAVVARGFSPADELVVYIRAGDVVQHDWFLQTDFAGQLRRFRNARRCSIVVCFAFQEFVERQRWLFSEEKLQKNIAMVSTLFAELLTEFPNIEFDVVSSAEIDRDFICLVTAPYFIPDYGGLQQFDCFGARTSTGNEPTGVHRGAAGRRLRGLAAGVR